MGPTRGTPGTPGIKCHRDQAIVVSLPPWLIFPTFPSSTPSGVFAFATCSEYVGTSYGSIISLGARQDHFIDKTPCLNGVSASPLQSLPFYNLSRIDKVSNKCPEMLILLHARSDRRDHPGLSSYDAHTVVFEQASSIRWMRILHNLNRQSSVLVILFTP